MEGREALEPSQAGPCVIEGAVTIEQALPALAADDGAEPEISIPGLLLDCPARGERTRLEGRL
jgi:hypothetical protein